MAHNTRNPFSVTKAVEYTDDEIRETWVSYPGGRLFDPADPTPLYLLGAKGSGRTHLLRYYSYQLQRQWENKLQHIKENRYVAAFFRCEGLSAGRFEDYLRTDQQRDAAFAYYFDLTLAIVLLDLEHQLGQDGLPLDGDMPEVIRALLKHPEHSVVDALREERRRLDRVVNNIPFSAKGEDIDFDVKANRAELVTAMATRLHRLLHQGLGREIQIVVFLDELENFFERQQRYVNTLVRERPPYLSLKIGAKTQGVKTLETFSANQANIGGSEYRIIYQDRVLRDNEKLYSEFVRNLILRRLHRQDEHDWLTKHFAEHSSEEFEFAKRDEGVLHKEPFMNWLNAQRLESSDRASLINSLLSLDDPLLEMGFMLHVLKNIGRAGDIGAAISASKEVSKAQLAHHKQSLASQLYRRYKQGPRPLCGLDTIVALSAGAVRNVLIILRNIWNIAEFEGFESFAGVPYSIKMQDEAIRQASSAFFHDGIAQCSNAGMIETGMTRIAGFLRQIRYADRPAESSPSTISIVADGFEKVDEVKEILRQCLNASLLLDLGDGTRAKNDDWTVSSYQMHPMLASYFDISHTRRGKVEVSQRMLWSCFCGGSDWEGFSKSRIEGMTVFGEDAGAQLAIFDEGAMT